LVVIDVAIDGAVVPTHLSGQVPTVIKMNGRNVDFVLESALLTDKTLCEAKLLIPVNQMKVDCVVGAGHEGDRAQNDKQTKYATSVCFTNLLSSLYLVGVVSNLSVDSCANELR
jgi:hypothetical protein